MATVPTTADVERAILDAISNYNVRAGEIVPLTGIQMKLDGLGIRANEFKTGLQSMVDKSQVEITGKFIKLTDSGFAAM
jgi:hypothetical protein